MTADRTLPEVHLHIGDTQLTTGSGGTYEHLYSPTGEYQATIPLAGQAEINDAVLAAHEAFATWRSWSPAARRDVMYRLYELIRERAADLACLSVMDNGMTHDFSKLGPSICADYAGYYAGWCDKLEGQVVSSFRQGGEFAYTLAEPYGVIGIIITWNVPIISLGMKLIPALAAGNTVVVKPSEFTPFVPELFMTLCREAGIPPGVVNIAPGSVAAGEALVAHPLVKKVTFTGGPTAAKAILKSCAEQFKPAVLELGGKSASLVFPDANLDVVASIGVYSSITALSGQGCAMPTRLLVHEKVYDEMVDKVCERARAIKLGDPFDPTVHAGPVVNAAAQARILGMIDRVRETNSGTIAVGGNRPGGDLARGFYVEPTVVTDVDPASEIAQVEVFGPVLSMMRFSTETEALEIANSTNYGLAAYLWTSHSRRIHRLAEALDAGGVYVNAGSPLAPALPFGGRGISGYGREGGREGIYEFLRTKAVAIA